MSALAVFPRDRTRGQVVHEVCAAAHGPHGVSALVAALKARLIDPALCEILDAIEDAHFHDESAS